MKHAAPVRRELGVRTLFNLLGPLTNPASAQNQVLGVFHPSLTRKLAQVLSELGSSHVLVVHGSDGLDEITINGTSNIAELKDGKISEYTVQPADFGLQAASLDAIRVTNADDAKAMLLSVLDNKPGSARDIVLLNAGAAIYVAGLTISLADGVNTASQVITSGAAKSKLAQLISISQRAAA
jgi:anthranilate phosphoribosyltransferase